MTSSIRNFRQALGMAAIATLALGGSLAPARAANQAGSSIMMMEQDLADREKDIHWAEGFDPSQADLFSHNALLINASCERIAIRSAIGSTADEMYSLRAFQPLTQTRHATASRRRSSSR